VLWIRNFIFQIRIRPRKSFRIRTICSKVFHLKKILSRLGFSKQLRSGFESLSLNAHYSIIIFFLCLFHNYISDVAGVSVSVRTSPWRMQPQRGSFTSRMFRQCKYYIAHTVHVSASYV
jgi:hypothetical protein